MKKSIAKFLIIAFLMLAVGIGGFMVWLLRGLSHFSWMNSMPSNIQRLASDVEYFKYNEGHYPYALTDLLTNEMSGDKAYLAAVLQAGRYQYGYQLVSNGFAITVVSPPGLLNRSEVMVRQFAPGEAVTTNKN